MNQVQIYCKIEIAKLYSSQSLTNTVQLLTVLLEKQGSFQSLCF